MARTIVGLVSSDKPDKTIVVTVQTRKTHPLYKKQYTVSRRFMAHDEKNEAHVGDKVLIVETRPLSARKHYALGKIIERPAIREEERIDVIEETDTGRKPEKEAKEEEATEAET